MDYSYLHFNPARPSQRTNFLLTDFATEYTDLERKSLGNQIMTLDQKQITPNIKESEFDKKQTHNNNFKLGYYLHLSNPKEWAFIILFSLIASLFFVFLDKLIFSRFSKKKNMVRYKISNIKLFYMGNNFSYFYFRWNKCRLFYFSRCRWKRNSRNENSFKWGTNI